MVSSTGTETVAGLPSSARTWISIRPSAMLQLLRSQASEFSLAARVSSGFLLFGFGGGISGYHSLSLSDCKFYLAQVTCDFGA